MRRDDAAGFDVDNMWRETAELIPGDNIVGNGGNCRRQIQPRECLARDVAEADFMTVAEKARPDGQALPDFCERVVAARRRNAGGFFKKRRLENISSSFPLGDLKAGAELRFSPIEAVSK